MGFYPFVLNAALTNPMTAAGDLIDGGAAGTPQRLAVGPNGDVLTVVAGAPAWSAAGAGSGTVTSVTATDASIVISGTSTIAPTVATGTLDVIAAQHPPVAAVGMNGQTATNLATPVNPSDASTKAYTDAVAQGLSIKPSVQEATAAALPTNTYSNGASGVGATLTGVATGVLTVDGIAVSLNDRVLVKNEAAAANNGIYTCTTAGALGVAYILTRATDMNAASEIPGAFCFVEQGTANAGAGFVVASEGPFTVGTTAINWTKFSGLTTPVSIPNGGTGQTTAAAAFAALAPTTTAGDLIIENATPAPARLAIGAANTSLQSNGSLPAWQISLTQQATTGVNGYSLVNGTGNIITWITPNDGSMHRVFVFAVMSVTMTEVGGTIITTATVPGGSPNNKTLIPVSQAAGIVYPSQGSNPTEFLIGPNTTFTISQSTALTSGASVLFAEIWGS